MIRDIYSIQYAGGGFVSQHTNYSGEAKKKKCVELPKLHYKLPMWFFKVFLASLKEESDTLQTLNTDFYNYAGKWKEFMSKNAECKYDKLWDTMSSAIHENQDLEDTIKGLEKCNDELMNIEEELADKIKKLEEENKKLKEYEKYKTAIHEYLIKNNIPEPISVEEGIQSFQSLTMNKILIRKADYDEYSKTKQEIEEYKTFMKLKNKFVSKLGDGVPTVTKMEEDASRTWGLFGGDDDW
jgi:phage host-nuclease inhibitor protein Gam